MALPSIYSKFITDPAKEVAGVDKDFGDFVVTCARAGGTNEAYGRVMSELFAPYQQVMDLGELSDEKSAEIWGAVLFRTVIKNWRFKEKQNIVVNDKSVVETVLVPGLGRDDAGNVVHATEENVLDLFKQAPDLFIEVKMFAERRETYALRSMQAASKN